MLSKLRKWAFVLAMATAPTVMTVVLVHNLIGSEISAYVPDYPNDLPGYWHVTATFVQHGFDGGYYGADEQVGSTAASKLDLHGAAIPVIFGSIGRIAGWGMSTAIWCNLAFLALALLIFMGDRGRGAKEGVAIGLVVCTAWSVLLNIPSTFPETLNQSLGLVFAALVATILRNRNPVTARRLILIVLFLCGASMVRVSWALLFVPVFILAGWTRPLREKFCLAALGLVAIGLCYKAFWLIAPPGENSVTSFFGAFVVDPLSGQMWSALVDRTLLRWSDFMMPEYGNWMEIAQAWQMVLLMAFALMKLLSPRTESGKSHGWFELSAKEAFFHLFNLGMMILAGLLTYIPSGFARVFSTPYVLSMALLVAYRRFGLVVVILLVGMVGVPSFLHNYESLRHNFTIDREKLDGYGKVFSGTIKFQKDAGSDWCNSLVVTVPLYDSRVLMIPAGIGINWIRGIPYGRLPYLSRYLLLDRSLFEALAPDYPMRVLADFPDSVLALNERSPIHCE